MTRSNSKSGRAGAPTIFGNLSLPDLALVPTVMRAHLAHAEGQAAAMAQVVHGPTRCSVRATVQEWVTEASGEAVVRVPDYMPDVAVMRLRIHLRGVIIPSNDPGRLARFYTVASSVASSSAEDHGDLAGTSRVDQWGRFTSGIHPPVNFLRIEPGGASTALAYRTSLLSEAMAVPRTIWAPTGPASARRRLRDWYRPYLRPGRQSVRARGAEL
jgi:hypothetical protein